MKSTGNSSQNRSVFQNEGQKNSTMISLGQKFANWINSTNGLYPIEIAADFQENFVPVLTAKEILVLQTMLLNDACFRVQEGENNEN